MLLDVGELHQSALQRGDGAPERGEVEAGGEALARRLAVAADDLPCVVAERAPRGVGARFQVDPAPGRQELGRDPPKRAVAAGMEVEGGREAERDLALHLLELGDPLRATRASCAAPRRTPTAAAAARRLRSAASSRPSPIAASTRT